MNDFIQRLRDRPLYQRHLIVWIGSLILFSGISWVWLYQVGNQLASLASPKTVIAQEEVKQGESTSYVVRMQEFFDAAKEGSASLFSFFSRQEKKIDTPAPIREGNELNEFLNEKGFEPFPE